MRDAATFLLAASLLGAAACGAADSGAPADPPSVVAPPEGTAIGASDSGVDAASGEVASTPKIGPSPWGSCAPRHWTASAAVAPMQKSSPADRAITDTATTLLADGRVVVGGGEAVYDPKADSYKLTPPEHRLFPLGSTQTVLADGRSVLIAGGAPDSYSSSSYAFVFDPDALTRSAVAPMLSARAGHGG